MGVFSGLALNIDFWVVFLSEGDGDVGLELVTKSRYSCRFGAWAVMIGFGP